MLNTQLARAASVAGLLSLLLSSGAAVAGPQADGGAPTPAEVAPSAAPTPPPAPSFESWRAALREEALGAGIRPETFDAAFEGVSPLERVIALDRRQPEGTISFQTYLRRVVTSGRVREGRRHLKAHRALLDEIGAKYGVQPRFIVALWGIETSYGKNTGGFSVVAALATLAWEGRRAKFFRRELLIALKILDAGHVPPARMRGSWAGALGQCQFMPSSFERFAQDYDGDGRKDIWGSQADVFASIAAYLSGVGWDKGRTWGRRVVLPAGYAPEWIDKTKARPLSEWQALGVRKVGGGALPPVEIEGALVQPGGAEGPTYLIYANYHTLLDWNRSLYFATAVGTLADKLGR